MRTRFILAMLMVVTWSTGCGKQRSGKLPQGLQEAFMLPDGDKDQYGNPVVLRDGTRFDTTTGNSYEVWLKEPRMELVLIPAGAFMMGTATSTQAPAGLDQGLVEVLNRETPQHSVRHTRSFYLGKYEVTQSQWSAMVPSHPTPWAGKECVRQDARHPAVSMSWDGPMHFFAKELVRVTGFVSFRLPTEAEWEYACRAGSTGKYCFGDDTARLGEYAWFRENAWDIGEKYAHAVGTRRPNAWGLYDMHGNVHEYCLDFYAPYKNAAETNPIVEEGEAESEFLIVARGGSIASASVVCGCASRWKFVRVEPAFARGFRMAMSLPPSSPSSRLD